MDNNQSINTPNFMDNKGGQFNPFGNSNSIEDDISNNVIKPGSKTKSTNEKPSV